MNYKRIYEARKEHRTYPSDLIEKYKDNPNVYFSFQNIPELKLNPRYTYETPLGIYGFPLKSFYETNRENFDGSEVEFIDMFLYRIPKIWRYHKYIFFYTEKNPRNTFTFNSPDDGLDSISRYKDNIKDYALELYKKKVNDKGRITQLKRRFESVHPDNFADYYDYVSNISKSIIGYTTIISKIIEDDYIRHNSIESGISSNRIATNSNILLSHFFEGFVDNGTGNITVDISHQSVFFAKSSLKILDMVNRDRDNDDDFTKLKWARRKD